MPTHIEKLLESYQSNSYPAMLDDLSQHLGVTADSLRRLALGYAPIVTFKKGPNFNGFWVIPERDSDGTPLGSSLRSQTDFKVMYPGSKHGLIFEVNPDHERGASSPDPGNWIRTMEAGVLCPVCGKPDGCLVNAANPTDPNGDAVCIRVRENAVKPMKFGYLHSKKKHTAGVSALPNNGGPVVVVEGMTDTATALDMDFDAIGRPSNLACMDMLCDLVRGRDVIVVGENDKKSDGSHPGREGMIATCQMVRASAKSVIMVLPPEHIKDLRAWKTKFGLTREAFVAFVAEHPFVLNEELVLADARPLTIANAYLNSQHCVSGRYTIRRWQGSWYRYNGACYEAIADEAFRQPIYRWAHDKQVKSVDAKGGSTLQPLIANNVMISNLAEAIMSETLVGDTTLPCWINGAKGPNPKDLIVFSNGILHVPSFVGGESESKHLLESTPDLFTTVALPYGYDATAECPQWTAFLASTFADDADKTLLLQEWFGYCLTPDTAYQTFAYLYGLSGSGKGTVVRVLRSVLGPSNCVSTTMGALSGRFGLEPLLGKQLCVLPDARLSPKSDSVLGLEKLLNLTGEDATNVDRKGKTELTINSLSARIMFVSNELLSLPDREHATARRIRILHFTGDFRSNPDAGLIGRLQTELPGIANWALEGLRRLRQHGRFTEPASSALAAKEWAIRTSEAAEFIDECCFVAANAQIFEDELYDAAVKWNERKDVWCRSKRQLVRSIRTAHPVVRFTKLPSGKGVYRGIALTPDAARRLLGKPISSR